MYEKIIIKRMFKDKSDISRWNYKRAFKAFLKELRDLDLSHLCLDCSTV